MNRFCGGREEKNKKHTTKSLTFQSVKYLMSECSDAIDPLLSSIHIYKYDMCRLAYMIG